MVNHAAIFLCCNFCEISCIWRVCVAVHQAVTVTREDTAVVAAVATPAAAVEDMAQVGQLM